jgi:hypothetical protein
MQLQTQIDGAGFERVDSRIQVDIIKVHVWVTKSEA